MSHTLQRYISNISYLVDTYCTIGPAKFDFIHHPKFMDVFCKFFPDPLQIGWQHNLLKKRNNVSRFIFQCTYWQHCQCSCEMSILRHRTDFYTHEKRKMHKLVQQDQYQFNAVEEIHTKS